MKVLEGIVVSNGMNKTIVVEVSRKTAHPLYKKLIKRSKKIKADSSGFEDVAIGAVVRITETRPISKNKYFKIAEVVGLKQTNNRKPAITENTEKSTEAQNKPSVSSVDKPVSSVIARKRSKRTNSKSVRLRVKKEGKTK